MKSVTEQSVAYLTLWITFIVMLVLGEMCSKLYKVAQINSFCYLPAVFENE